MGVGNSRRQPGLPGAMLGDDAVFSGFALQLFVSQFAVNIPYRNFCRARGVAPGKVAHWSDIPAISAGGFKEWELSCIPGGERTGVFFSSGTTEQVRSRHFHHAASLAVYEASLMAWFDAHFAPGAGPGKGGMAVLTPSPVEAPNSSLVHMFETIRRARGVRGNVFVGEVDESGAWVVDGGRAVEQLQRLVAGGGPGLVMGTAFSFVHLLDFMAERGVALRLPAGTRVLETGGYKGRSRELPKGELHAAIAKGLGLRRGDVRCEYGMSELSSQAYDVDGKEGGRVFRFPPWARCRVVSAETGREVKEGEAGLVRVFDLANVYSVMAIQTEDLAVRRRDGFELLGRAARSEPRGCSLMAA